MNPSGPASVFIFEPLYIFWEKSLNIYTGFFLKKSIFSRIIKQLSTFLWLYNYNITPSINVFITLEISSTFMLLYQLNIIIPYTSTVQLGRIKSIYYTWGYFLNTSMVSWHRISGFTISWFSQTRSLHNFILINCLLLLLIFNAQLLTLLLLLW